MRSNPAAADAALLIARWQQQIGQRGNSQHRQMQRLAALGYLANGPVCQGFIALQHLVLVVLHAEPRQGEFALAGFSAAPVEWGVAWGGPMRNPFLKDLALEPAAGARGRQLDLSRRRLVELGLQLERDLRRAGRSRRLPLRRRLSLPRLWAGVWAADAHELQGDGPEFANACRRSGNTPRELFRQAARNHQGLKLLPLEWISHRWQQFVAVFAELGRFPQRQVFRLRDPQHDLAGYRGASHFDFYDSRFSGVRIRRNSCAPEPPAVTGPGHATSVELPSN